MSELVERLRGYCHDLRDSQWLRVVPAMSEAADRIEALEKALRAAHAALEKGDDWHYEGDDMNEPPLRKGDR